MNLAMSREWFERRALLEGDTEINAGSACGTESMMPRNVFAYTAPGAIYPEYISVNQAGHDGYSVTVRSPAKADGSEGASAIVALTSEQARELAAALLNDTSTDAG